VDGYATRSERGLEAWPGFFWSWILVLRCKDDKGRRLLRTGGPEMQLLETSTLLDGLGAFTKQATQL
jgi:hypothetical protein